MFSGRNRRIGHLAALCRRACAEVDIHFCYTVTVQRHACRQGVRKSRFRRRRSNRRFGCRLSRRCFCWFCSRHFCRLFRRFCSGNYGRCISRFLWSVNRSRRHLRIVIGAALILGDGIDEFALQVSFLPVHADTAPDLIRRVDLIDDQINIFPCGNGYIGYFAAFGRRLGAEINIDLCHAVTVQHDTGWQRIRRRRFRGRFRRLNRYFRRFRRGLGCRLLCWLLGKHRHWFFRRFSGRFCCRFGSRHFSRFGSRHFRGCLCRFLCRFRSGFFCRFRSGFFCRFRSRFLCRFRSRFRSGRYDRRILRYKRNIQPECLSFAPVRRVCADLDIRTHITVQGVPRIHS